MKDPAGNRTPTNSERNGALMNKYLVIALILGLIALVVTVGSNPKFFLP